MPAPPATARHALMLLALSALAWAPGLAGEFQYDDLPNIVLDRATADPAVLLQRLGNGFRPLLRLSYVLDHRLWGFVPFGFLLTNLLIHLATVLAVWRLAGRRLAGGPAGCAALVAALVFALQPAHAAVVASASGRSTGLSTLLLVLALLAHDRSLTGAPQRHRARGSRVLAAGALLLFALATLAKEVALVFPALVLLWEWTRPEPAPLPQRLRRVAPAAIAAAALAMLAFAFSARLRAITAFSLDLAAPIDALAVHAAALPLSLSLWFRPWALSIEHAALPPDAWRFGLPVLLALLVLVATLWRRWPLAAFALAWPLVMCLPTHSILARLDPVVEKALYPAWIGPSLGLGAMAALLWTRSSRAGWPSARTLAAAGVLGLAALTCAWRAARWADPAALWREATEHAPQSARAWHNRALAELGIGRMADAKTSIERALALDDQSQRHHDTARAISLFPADASTPVPEPPAAPP